MQKVLGQLGLNNDDANYLVGEVDSRTKGNFFNLTETGTMGGKLRLGVEMHKDYMEDVLHMKSGGIHKLELNFTPDDSHWQTGIRTDRAFIGYRLKF